MNDELKKLGFLAQEGTIVDTTFVKVPIQRNSKEENDEIKQDKTLKDWENKAEKLRQKDTDARWAKKGDESYFGYKNHVAVNTKDKLIENYEVTPAHVHDSVMFYPLVHGLKKGSDVYADKAYFSQEISDYIKDKGFVNKILKKGAKNHPLTEEEKALNKLLSKVRARIEHVFGTMTNSFGGIFIRSIGQRRSETNIRLLNILYNIVRGSIIMRQPSICA